MTYSTKSTRHPLLLGHYNYGHEIQLSTDTYTDRPLLENPAGVHPSISKPVLHIYVDYHLCIELRSCVKVEVAVLGSPVPNSPYGFCGRKATLNSNSTVKSV